MATSGESSEDESWDGEVESGFEFSEEDIDVDGAAVDLGLAGLQDKGKRKVIAQDSDRNENEGSDTDSDEENEEKSDEFRNNRNPKKILPRFQEFREGQGITTLSFKLGLSFPSSKVFKDAIREYAIREGKDIYFKKNDSKRVRAACNDKSCKWVCYASTMGTTGLFIIKTYNPIHSCPRVNRNRFATAPWLAKTYMQTFKDSESWSAPDFMNRVQKDFVLECNTMKAYRAKRFATNVIEGSNKEQYAALWDYAAELKRSNPGSTIEIVTEGGFDGKPVFKRIYICFQACKLGFVHCRPVIGIDGCHIKGHHTGQLLSAIGIDANNSMFPIAYAVVESEGKSSWSWFFNLLKVDVNINNGNHWTFISDKQKGLQEALNDLWDEGSVQGEHRHCARHLQGNFSKVFRGQFLKTKMMAAAMAYSTSRFEAELELIKAENKDAYNWLIEKRPQHWARSMFRPTTSRLRARNTSLSKMQPRGLFRDT